MKISSIDGSKNIMIHLKLDAPEFEYFFCEKPIVLGVNMNSMFKLIKTINNSDTLSFFVDDNSPGILNIRIENSEKTTTYKYNLLEIDNPSFKIQPKEFSSIISMPSSDFQKICRDMNNMGGAKTVDIKAINDQLIFTCKGEIAEQSTIIKTGGEVGGEKFAQGEFSLKFLTLFTKATNLCNNINIYITNDYPIIIEYSVASLGSVRFILKSIN
jgi:proliferating cell nuclear antigen